MKGDKHIHEYIRSEQAKGSNISSIRKGLHEKGVHPKKVDHHLRISYKFDQSIIDYVHKEIRKKYTIEQITQALLKAGHDKEKVTEHVKHAHHLHKKKKKKQAVSIVGASLLFISLLGFIFLGGDSGFEEFTGEHWDYLASGDFDRAIAGFQEDLKTNPDDFGAKTGLGLAYANTGELDKGLPLLSEAVEHYHGDTTLRKEYARFLLEDGQSAEAEEQYTIALELVPEDGELLNGLAWALFNQQKYDEAEDQFSNSISTGYIPAHLGFARVAMKTERYNVAIESFEEARRSEAFNADMRAHYGFSLMMENRLEEARKELEKAIKEDPNTEMAYRTLGDVDMREIKFDDAYANYEKALQLNPQFPQDIHYRIGRTFYVRENFPLAVDAFEKALELDSESIDFKTSLAWSNYQAGRYEDALSLFSELIEISQKGEYESGLGLTLEKMGRFEEATTHLENAITLDEPYHAHIGLGRISYKQKDFAAASASYSKALEIMDKENKQGVGDVSRYLLEIEMIEGPK